MWSKKQLKIKFARRLRREQTKPEEILWWLLRGRRMLGYKFRRQHIIDGFVVDFYCPSARLGIELDGAVHLGQRDYDEARQKVIEGEGVRVLRFTNAQLRKKPERVLETIIQNLPLLSAISTLLPSPRSGEGGPSPKAMVDEVGEELSGRSQLSL